MKLDANIVVANIEGNKKILIVSETFRDRFIVSHDLNGNEYMLEYDLGGFNGFTGKGWLEYWIGNQRLKPVCLCEEITQVGLTKNCEVKKQQLKVLEDIMNDQIIELS